MRYCPYCHRWNAGRPQRCNYCNRTWHIRLCPRSHENPHDAQFCGICGSADLTDTAGPRPWWVWLFWFIKYALLLGLLLLIVLALIGLAASPRQQLPFILGIALLLFGYGLAMSIMAGPTRRLVRSITDVVNKTLKRYLNWFWEKIKFWITWSNE